MTVLVTGLGSPLTMLFRASGSNVHPNLLRMGVNTSQFAMRCVLPDPEVLMASSLLFRPKVALMVVAMPVPCMSAV